jgi:hypothetical protein
VEEITTSKTGKHGHAKANYYGYDIFTGKRYEDSNPTTHNVMVPVVTRTEYILTDVNQDDVTEDGAICTLMTEGGDQREDLRLPTGDEWNNLRAAFEDASASGAKEVIITVVSAMGINRIDPQFVLKDVKVREGRPPPPHARKTHPTLTAFPPRPAAQHTRPTAVSALCLVRGKGMGGEGMRSVRG